MLLARAAVLLAPLPGLPEWPKDAPAAGGLGGLGPGAMPAFNAYPLPYVTAVSTHACIHACRRAGRAPLACKAPFLAFCTHHAVITNMQALLVKQQTVSGGLLQCGHARMCVWKLA